MVLHAMNNLHGERHAPELPLPNSAVRAYAERFGLSSSFCGLVTAYDNAILRQQQKQSDAENKKLNAMQSKASRPAPRAQSR